MYYTKTKLGKINPGNFLGNAKQESPCQSLERFSGEYYNKENKILDASTKLVQLTVLEATKMKQKSNMTDGVQKDGVTVKNVNRCQPVKGACAVTKFRQLRHFILSLKQDSPGIQLFWKFSPWNFIVQEINS